MLMPTSHFLGQVWEFPICGSAPAQRNQDHSDFGSVSSYFSCPPSCSWYLFPIAMRFGSEAAPALPRARQKRLSGAVGSVWYQPGAAPWCCSGRRQSGGIPAASSCRIPALLVGVWWGRWLQTALESSGFSPGWQLGSVSCVCPLCHCRVSLPASGVPCQHRHLAGTCPPCSRKGFNPAWALSLFTLEIPKVLTTNFLLFLRDKSLPWALSVQ